MRWVQLGYALSAAMVTIGIGTFIVEGLIVTSIPWNPQPTQAEVDAAISNSLFAFRMAFLGIAGLALFLTTTAYDTFYVHKEITT